MDVNSERDDLTAIKGIGEAYQQWLREALGINTFDDLAALSIDELESHVRAAGRSVSRGDLEAWIDQAQELAGPASPGTENSEEPEDEGKVNLRADEGDWKPTASFVVEFQARETADEGQRERRTVVHHVEADTDAEWPSIESVELCRWMLEQLDEPALDLAEEARVRAQEQLERELEETRTAARQQLDQELEEERSAMRQELEEERKEVRQRAQQTLQRELAGEKARAQQALEEELAQSRTKAEEALERELEEVRAQVEETLERERARAQEELAESLEQQRLEAKAELEMELEEYQREAKRTLDRQLEQARAEAEEELKRELAGVRSQALQDLEQDLAELRAQGQRELQEERVEAPAEIRPAREPAPEEPSEEPRTAEREEVPAVLEAPPSVKITALRAIQSSHTYDLLDGAAPETSAFLEPGHPFSLEASFELDRDEVTVLSRQGTTFAMQSYVREVSGGTTTDLGATPQSRIVAGQTAYTAELPNVTLSSGRYELVVVVTVQSSPPNFDYRELPMIVT